MSDYSVYDDQAGAMTPDFVVAGHLTLDKGKARHRLGGAAYSALAASRLGRRVGLLTSFGPELGPAPPGRRPEGWASCSELEGVEVVARPSSQTTVFRNSYRAGLRRQKVLSFALPLDAAEIPPSWRQAAIVHLSPMLGEVGREFLEAFPRALMGASPQGWLRRVGADGQVAPSPWGWADAALSRLDLVVVSQEDLAGNEGLALDWESKARCLVVTQGEGGAWVSYRGEKRHIPAARARKVVDPTGAGDVFAAAFLVKWAEGLDPFQAASFASAAASFVVEQEGLAGVPTASQVQERWRSV